MKSPPWMAFVMAGGQGTRLQPLTDERCKPSLPFDAGHRIVDFVLSNLVNSGIDDIQLLVQYKSAPLIEHVRSAWPTRYGRGIHALAPRARNGFRGNADAVAQNLELVRRRGAELVAVFAADHVYRMDVRQMVDAHLANDAEVSIATLPVPLPECPRFGIVETDGAGWVRRFREKPQRCAASSRHPGRALASMGNYLFNADVLLDALRHPDTPPDADFGRDVLPRLIAARRRVLAYDFAANRVPGIESYEESGYWRDVGTLDAYLDAHFDTLGRQPRFRLDNPAWPIHAGAIDGAAGGRYVAGSGCAIGCAWLDHAWLRSGVCVADDACIEQSIVMDRCVVGRGAKLVRAIVDEGNCVPEGECIGGEAERKRGRFHVSESGIAVVPRGYFPVGAR